MAGPRGHKKETHALLTVHHVCAHPACCSTAGFIRPRLADLRQRFWGGLSANAGSRLLEVAAGWVGARCPPLQGDAVVVEERSSVWLGEACQRRSSSPPLGSWARGPRCAHHCGHDQARAGRWVSGLQHAVPPVLERLFWGMWRVCLPADPNVRRVPECSTCPASMQGRSDRAGCWSAQTYGTMQRLTHECCLPSLSGILSTLCSNGRCSAAAPLTNEHDSFAHVLVVLGNECSLWQTGRMCSRHLPLTL